MWRDSKHSCANCKALCCSCYDINISKEDATAISKVIKKPISVFAQVGAEEGEFELRKLEGYCVLLNPKTFKCSVYKQRPITCKVYKCDDRAKEPREEIYLEVAQRKISKQRGENGKDKQS